MPEVLNDPEMVKFLTEMSSEDYVNLTNAWIANKSTDSPEIKSIGEYPADLIQAAQVGKPYVPPPGPKKTAGVNVYITAVD